MAIYQKVISYNGATITITAETQTGTTPPPETPPTVEFAGCQCTNSVTLSILKSGNTNTETLTDVRDDQLIDTLVQQEQVAKDYIDGVNDSALNTALVQIGFVKQP